jgi:hypothetical protein
MTSDAQQYVIAPPPPATLAVAGGNVTLGGPNRQG